MVDPRQRLRRVEFQRAAELALGLLPVPVALQLDERQRRVRLRQIDEIGDPAPSSPMQNDDGNP